MTDLSFGRPLWLLLVPAALVLFPVAWMTAQRAFAGAAGLTRQPPKARWEVTVLLVLAVLLASLAAAQPRWGERSATLHSGGGQLVVVLDVSRSMGATDVMPSRLAAARTAVSQTFSRLRGDRVALVVFAGDARLRFPLTRDLEAAAIVAESVEGGTLLLEPGTSAASGIDLARELFDEVTTGGRLVLLISDGENLGGNLSSASAKALRAEGIDLLVAGVGTELGSVVPVRDPISGELDSLRTKEGKAIISRLNEDELRAIAEAGEGRYLGVNSSSIAAVVRSRIATLDQSAYTVVTISLPIERFQWFAAAALALVLLATTIEWRVINRWSRVVLFGLVAALALTVWGCATEAHDLNERALEAFYAGDSSTAIELLYEAQAEDPYDGQIALNLASVLHQQGRYDEAIRIARRALTNRRVGIAAGAHASLGHHFFALGDLEESLAAFAEALLLTPEDSVLRRDYEIVYRLLYPDPTPEQQGDQPSAKNEEGSGESQQLPDPAPEPSSGQGGVPSGGGEGGEEGLSPQELEQQLAAIDTQVDEIRARAGGVLSAREALAILELLEERTRLAAQNPMRGVRSGPGDY